MILGFRHGLYDIERQTGVIRVCRFRTIYIVQGMISVRYNSFMQTLVIGDIHGCFHELLALLDKAGLGQDDSIISIGDCVDRGPETPQVLNFFRDTSNARLIMGNHERKHIRGSRKEVKLARSQQISKIQFGDAYPEALAFMEGLPLYIDLPEAIIVHGYFEPGIPPEQQNPLVLCGTMGGEKHLRTHYDRPWYELYDRDKPVLIGHENYSGTDQPFIHQDRVFGLDTNCVTGKALTGLLLPSFQFVSVPSRANHWMQMRRKYPKPQPAPPRPRPALTPWNEDEERALVILIGEVYQKSESILRGLQSRPGYTQLRPRQQARLFGEMAGEGLLAILLQLARLNKLNAEIARKIIKSPDKVQDLSIT